MCAVLSHSRQAIIWFVQWCVYQINNKAFNCPVSNFQEKGQIQCFLSFGFIFYTVEKNVVIITQLHYIGFHWLWTLDAPIRLWQVTAKISYRSPRQCKYYAHGAVYVLIVFALTCAKTYAFGKHHPLSYVMSHLLRMPVKFILIARIHSYAFSWSVNERKNENSWSLSIHACEETN